MPPSKADIAPDTAADGPRPFVLLDISRTVARARLPAPTGIDRVERAYIDWALDRDAAFLTRIGTRLYVVGAVTVRALTAWLDGGAAPPMDLTARLRPDRNERLRRAQALIRTGALVAPGQTLRHLKAGVYLNVGHDNLDGGVMDALRAAGLARAVMIHDTIPLDHPGLSRQGAPERFRQAFDAALGADLLIANSRATADAVRRHGAKLPPVHIAPLGITPVARAMPEECGFLCLGTIEPRKNHALLLDVWDRLGPDAPPLTIVGRRGWRNEDVFRRLDQPPPNVHEVGAVDDARLARLMAGARAILFPSLAEGYGLPLGEALAAGIPALASDLAALREIGGDGPDWLPPKDRDAWLGAIRSYGASDAPARAAQLARLTNWRAPTWPEHFSIVENALETILVHSGTAR